MLENVDITIDNFRKVNDWLYRGGQPDLLGLQKLQSMGVKTIINLRYNTQIIVQEKDHCKSLNLNYFPISLNYVIPPTNAQIKKFFNIIENSSYHSIYLHCKHGCDRTGLLVAMFRICYDNYSFKEAYTEMLDSGFHKIKMHHFKYILSSFASSIHKYKKR